jgi:hypothetical protein
VANISFIKQSLYEANTEVNIKFVNRNIGKISGCRGSEYDDDCLLGCCAIIRLMMMEAASTSEMLVNFCQTTWCNILEESSSTEIYIHKIVTINSDVIISVQFNLRISWGKKWVLFLDLKYVCKVYVRVYSNLILHDLIHIQLFGGGRDIKKHHLTRCWFDVGFYFS